MNYKKSTPKYLKTTVSTAFVQILVKSKFIMTPAIDILEDIHNLFPFL